MDDIPLDGDSDLLEADLQVNPLSSDQLNKMDEGDENGLPAEPISDDLFDVDFDFKPEDLEALDVSSNGQISSVQQGLQQGPDEDALFGDGYDELMDLDLDDTQSEVMVQRNGLT